jgi:predicted HicB family RNase H-like nuclease
MGQDKGIQKKKGRPPGKHFGEVVTVRLSTETTEKLERWAERRGVSRSKAARQLLERGLAKGRGK